MVSGCPFHCQLRPAEICAQATQAALLVPDSSILLCLPLDSCPIVSRLIKFWSQHDDFRHLLGPFALHLGRAGPSILLELSLPSQVCGVSVNLGVTPTANQTVRVSVHELWK